MVQAQKIGLKNPRLNPNTPSTRGLNFMCPYVTRGLQQRHADLGFADTPSFGLALIH